MRRHRHPVYAPESLERKLSPSDLLPIPVTAEVAPPTKPDPGPATPPPAPTPAPTTDEPGDPPVGTPGSPNLPECPAIH